ncbi:MAG: phosphatidylserine decarboxylase family protein [Proteobacteria bacterium]|uniref:phosphatidylserine decarboxylase n=1 Tax=Aquabacterium sp. TaxID=1872578 RepID=UPI0035C74B16|nr:phosphatidylserine decarboxylase family protein [Pseudomonadota bacterium]
MSSLYLFARGHRLLTAVVVLFTLGLAWLLGDGWGLLFSVLMAALAVLLWRDAPRAVPTQSGAVLSPADGRVVRIEKARDPYADRDALRISVFMNLFDAHANRASVDGVIRQVQYFPGAAISTDLDTASARHERNAVVIESNGELVTLVQVAGLIARRILCTVKPGDTLTRGQRYGLIRFGSRVDIYLPPHAVPKVAPGERVSATTTILATLANA